MAQGKVDFFIGNGEWKGTPPTPAVTHLSMPYEYLLQRHMTISLERWATSTFKIPFRHFKSRGMGNGDFMPHCALMAYLDYFQIWKIINIMP